MDQYKHSNIDVLILCGGAGTRFRAVSNDIPKAMADMNGKPFLDILLEYYIDQSFERFILCTGYMSDYIKDYYQDSKFHPYVFFSEEKNPLGTGGAIKNAEPHIINDDFLVMNGDSFCDIDTQKFITFHMQKTDALVSVALTKVDERDDTGKISIDETTSLIHAFQEKNMAVPKPYINTGIYAFKKKILEIIPQNKNYSLEYHLFPQIAKKSLYGFVSDKKLIDIGTPERYHEAKTFFRNFSHA